MLETQIIVDDLRIYAHHGVSRQERTVGNWFSVSATATLALTADQLHSDELNQTLSYAHMAFIIKQQMSTPSNLLENVAMRIIDALAATDPQISQLDVCVKKLTPPIGLKMQAAAVKISWKNPKSSQNSDNLS